MAGLFFSESLLQQFVLHAELGEHLLQPPVLVLQPLHLRDHRGVHAAVFRPPFVERRAAHLVLAAQRQDRDTLLRLTQDPHDLGVREPTLLHPNLLVRKTEKILRPHPLISRGDYPSPPIPGVACRPIAGESLFFYAVWLPTNDNPALRRFLSLAKVLSKQCTACAFKDGLAGPSGEDRSAMDEKRDGSERISRLLKIVSERCAACLLKRPSPIRVRPHPGRRPLP
ncbi:hypothetical protein PHAMO_540002 [Magnetospirillum molischianum DSM 120]|uniref:Uncharacterized protein n=1 Tax=Magnetospirillum molischianum DSM 120 TaxID=1150626 RepID=H8FXB4_MAGML|nr:hypothetical protein PHAMO_540002 [Magnetospirillum molischianum DSM 120]